MPELSKTATPQPAPAEPSPAAGPLSAPSARSRLAHYYILHLLGALFPMTAGLALYGWKALASSAMVISAAILAVAVWRRIGSRGAMLRRAHAIWLAALLSLMLPPHLLTDMAPGLPHRQLWIVLPAAGVLLVILMWLLGGLGHWRLHPLLLTYLILTITFGDVLAPRLVLHRARVVVGDLMDYPAPPDTGKIVRDDRPLSADSEEAWVYQRGTPPADAIVDYETSAGVAGDPGRAHPIARIRRVAPQFLTEYTRGNANIRRAWTSVDALLRDAMPPLEDLVVGGHPGPIGSSSAVAVLVGGLFLIYKRLIDPRIPLLTISVAYFAFLLLPVPVAITESATQWRPLVMPRAHIDLATMISFVNYEVMASPLLLMAFFLATSGAICPTARNARRIYAVVLGLLAAGCQLYISCSIGPYIALLAAALLTPWLDARFAQRGIIPRKQT